jgi:hypothetical protein
MACAITYAVDIANSSLIVVAFVIVEKTGSLHSSSQGFICPFLAPTQIHLMLIVNRSWPSQSIWLYPHFHFFGHSHVL